MKFQIKPARSASAPLSGYILLASTGMRRGTKSKNAGNHTGIF
jgi:hypothetical protein